MKHTFLLFFLLFFAGSSICQTKYIVINHHNFIVKTKKVKNEWNSFDKVKELYRIENGKQIYVLKYYAYKDDGSDCNNVFWSKETMKVKKDSIIFLTEYFQKTNMDPIPEWRKQIYQVKADGHLILIYDKYKYRHNAEWVNE